ncbi:glycoside hydrolase family 92 protein [Mixia osmundae IAM 14324]|uniref:Glycoside hydrolase family 92 protein n=1 Tax=Mixia osmundae (strain CBS 9802 / IAM 14324 / JCM 22182 / KY 12970) TaxID=764103 RepID=G7DU14_MIXOS|nr:glycoside hydrolase family 92 protein [Mixia osmundae IAM 14324]KEI37084.1 glycoside hydrolase family 92 protein [Mixia osmundae IAM 14324]GAA94074.1 hypothetical protein E5Q_00721 [Mixia osmundae IAM 14324]
MASTSLALLAVATLASAVDWTAYVDPFIGTTNAGNVCPGASVPFGLVKISADMAGYAPAGYIGDMSAAIEGFAPIHTSGIGGVYGSYASFKVMPMICASFETCTTRIADRSRLRQAGKDKASPGYFALTLDDGIRFEATSTRRAGLERITYPASSRSWLSIDLSHDSANGFSGGNMTIDPVAGRVTAGGFFKPSFGPRDATYSVYACYDVGKVTQYGVWTGDGYDLNAKAINKTSLTLPDPQGEQLQSGALLELDTSAQHSIRVGVSFVSEEQACANADQEIGQDDFDTVLSKSRALWNEKLSRLEVDVDKTSINVTKMLYSSSYRSFLTPSNATGERVGRFADPPSNRPFFDDIYTSWDTFRTATPWLSLHSPQDLGELVGTYLDGFQRFGYIEDARGEQLPGYAQGGSDAEPILSDWVVKYGSSFSVDGQEVMSALDADATNTPKQWIAGGGRENDLYEQYGYIPTNALVDGNSGVQTRQVSRTLEYAFNDFTVATAARAQGNPDRADFYFQRSLYYRNVFVNASFDGFTGFAQQRLPNGSFILRDPRICSPLDTNATRSCSLQQGTSDGFYEASSWEYSFFAPHDMAGLIDLTAQGNRTEFIRRLDYFFDQGLFDPSNEPSFATPLAYHYVDRPDLSIKAVRKIVAQSFGIGKDGLPGNDDQAAMATLLIFHLLGMFPVPGTTQMLLGSPSLPSFNITNAGTNSKATFSVTGYDPRTLMNPPPVDAKLYVRSITINGQAQPSTCFVDFRDVFVKNSTIVIELTASTKEGGTCHGAVPDSLSTGGWKR